MDLDRYWMGKALELAQEAGRLGEVPIGAIIVRDGHILGQGYNLREVNQDATAHAEIQAIRQANQNLAAWRLEGATLYVTLEPCPMCAGAIINARIHRLVYGASDPKGGCAGTLMNLLEDSPFNHQVQVESGVMEEACSQILTDFFRQLRQKKKARPG